jgi:flagellar basal-body rod protein FlgC
VSGVSGPFSGLGIAASGMTTYKSWIDAISDNVANIDTARSTSEAAFQERFMVAKSLDDPSGGPGNGVAVDHAAFGDPTGRLVYEPSNPLADSKGMVRYPDIDLSEQMTNLMEAQRAYQLNASVFERARDAYSKALEIGK